MISLKKKTTTCWSNKNYYLLTKLLSCFSRVQLCDLIDGSPPGSPVPGILQARTLEWVAISFSNAWKVKVKSLSRVRPSVTPWTACSLPGSSIHGIFQARVLEWGASQVALFSSLQQPHKIVIISPLFHLRKLRLRDVMALLQNFIFPVNKAFVIIKKNFFLRHVNSF